MDTVLILDFGAQYSRLIARRVREQNVFCEVLPHSASAETIRSKNPIGIIFPAVRTAYTRPARLRSIRRCSRSAFPCSASATAVS